MEEISIALTVRDIISSIVIITLLVLLAVLYQKYKQALSNSMVDALTGLFNTRYLNQRLREEISRASRFGHLLYLLFIDLDKFKSVNDTFGHREGDEVLKEAAKALLKTMRLCDIVVRNGGDEFVVLAAEVSEQDIANIAERIRLALKRVSTANCANPVTASIGLHRVDITKPEDVALKMADAAMYAAKDLGGDRIITST